MIQNVHPSQMHIRWRGLVERMWNNLYNLFIFPGRAHVYLLNCIEQILIKNHIKYCILNINLNRGKFSVVKEAVENATNKPCALKIMKKSVVQEHNLLKEVEILRHLNHTNIVALLDIYETDLDLILVLELYVFI